MGTRFASVASYHFSYGLPFVAALILGIDRAGTKTHPHKLLLLSSEPGECAGLLFVASVDHLC